MTRLNLKKFEKNLTVRPLRPTDYDDVVALQRQCFPTMTEVWSKEQFLSQLATFPEGQVGVENQGKLVASTGSLILDFGLYKDWHNYDEIPDFAFIRNHNPAVKTLYGFQLTVDPPYPPL